MYLQLRLIKQYGVGGRSFLVLRLSRKRKKERREMNEYTCGVSRGKAL